jgi:hypothetical protein
VHNGRLLLSLEERSGGRRLVVCRIFDGGSGVVDSAFDGVSSAFKRFAGCFDCAFGGLSSVCSDFAKSVASSVHSFSGFCASLVSSNFCFRCAGGQSKSGKADDQQIFHSEHSSFESGNLRGGTNNRFRTLPIVKPRIQADFGPNMGKSSQTLPLQVESSVFGCFLG